MEETQGLSGVKERSCKCQMPVQPQRPAPTTPRAAADGLAGLEQMDWWSWECSGHSQAAPGKEKQNPLQDLLRAPVPAPGEAEQGTRAQHMQSQHHVVLPAFGLKVQWFRCKPPVLCAGAEPRSAALSAGVLCFSKNRSFSEAHWTFS